MFYFGHRLSVGFGLSKLVVDDYFDRFVVLLGLPGHISCVVATPEVLLTIVFKNRRRLARILLQDASCELAFRSRRSSTLGLAAEIAIDL